MLPDLYTAQDINLSSDNRDEIVELAKKKAFAEERPILVFKNGEKIMTIGGEIYKIKDTSIKTFSLTKAIEEGVRLAKKMKKDLWIIRNGQEFKFINKIGSIALA